MTKVADLKYNALPETQSRLDQVTKAIEAERATQSQEGLVREVGIYVF